MAETKDRTPMSRGKRSIMEHEYSVDVREWAKCFRVPVPSVRVRQRRAGHYRAAHMRITVPPNSSRDSLVHEFAHHLNHVLYKGQGHGPSFRVALVQAATVAYGRAEIYNWSREYVTIQSWARKHGLARLDG